MVLSMTGYGRAELTLHGRAFLAEVRSVNARFLEGAVRVPRGYGYLEAPLTKLLKASMQRGKVDLSLSWQAVEAPDTAVEVNLPLLRGYRQAVQTICEATGAEGRLTALELARFPEVLTLRQAGEDEAELQADALAAAGEALRRFNEMRQREGESLSADLAAKLDGLEATLAKVEAGSEGRVEAYRLALTERLQKLLADAQLPQDRIVAEAALLADKTAIDEETVRLHSHIAQYREILAAGGAVGRKLDFLTQELNRETNTIGSKCQDLAITRCVVDMKSMIEKLREQIQNLE